MQLLVLGVALLLFLGPPDGQSHSPASSSDCPVSISLIRSEYATSGKVSPALVSHGPDKIWIPRWWPRGYRVEVLEKAKTGAAPSITHRLKKEVLEYDPLRFSFAKPELLGIAWKEDVGVAKTEYGFVVPAGRYRLSVTFSIDDPRKEKGDSLKLCTVYSPPFVVAKDSEWTSFY
jgi:hypothetical protein